MRAAQITKEVVDNCQEEGSYYAEYLINLIVLIQYLYYPDGKKNLSRPKNAIQTSDHNALELNQQPTWFSTLALLDLATLLKDQYHKTRRNEDLVEWIDFTHRAANIYPDNTKEEIMCQENLGAALFGRYESYGNVEDLTHSTTKARMVLAGTQPGDDAEGSRLIDVLIRVQHLKKEGLATESMDEIIQLSHKCLGHVSMRYDGHRAAACLNHAELFSMLYGQTGEIKHLEKAIEYARMSLDPAKGTQNLIWKTRAALANHLFKRYIKSGKMRDLDESISMARVALKVAPGNTFELSVIWEGLVLKLQERFASIGESEDLEEAIFLRKKGIEGLSSNPQRRAENILALSRMILLRGGQKQSIKTFREAAKMARDAIELLPLNYHQRPEFLHNYSTVMKALFDHTADKGYLEEAIRASRESMASEESTCTGECLSFLASLLRTMFLLTKDRVFQVESFLLSKKALDPASKSCHSQCIKLLGLGNAFKDRFFSDTKWEYLNLSIKSYIEAWRCLSGRPGVRIAAAAAALPLLAIVNRVAEGTQLGEEVLDFMSVVHTKTRSRIDQQVAISDFAGVASDVCGLYLANAQLEAATECLERGRTVIINQIVNEKNQDLTSLGADHPTLAFKYQKLVEDLNRATRSPLAPEITALPPDDFGKQRRKIAQDLEACLKEIRDIPEHKAFLLGRPVAEMQQSIVEGTIVIVNITTTRRDAIIVSKDSLTALKFPEELESLANCFDERGWLSKNPSEQREKNDMLLHHLERLWHVCVKEIIEKITSSRSPSKQGSDNLKYSLPRIWWIGTYKASSIPFHAAGVHRGGSTENAYSKVTSSYTPSISALSFSKAQMNKTATRNSIEKKKTGEILVVAMPSTPKGPEGVKKPEKLAGVTEEVAQITTLAHTNDRTISTFFHPSANEVLQKLSHCQIIHFACHGVSDRFDPSSSGVILQTEKKITEDGTAAVPEQDFLTVYRISELKLKHAQVAYLSACSTAESRIPLLKDEMIHVASGFQVAGFPHVVGCLWPAGDSECVEVSKRFYSSILDETADICDGGTVAVALQNAVMAVRAADPEMPALWAQFVHYGA